jgi:hypothetical protein
MENTEAFAEREHMMHHLGRPGSSVRPELTTAWLLFGCVAAVTFTAIGEERGRETRERHSLDTYTCV